MIAARLADDGTRVVCVGTPATTAVIREQGIELVTPDGVLRSRPEAVELLAEPVTLLVVAVKEPALPEALERVEAYAVADGVVLPLLNGLEAADVIRRRVGPRVAPGTISRYSGEVVQPGHVLQRTPSALVTAAPGDVPRPQLERSLRPLAAAGIGVEISDDERAVLWDKAARLAVLAAATVASGRPVSELRSDEAWRARIDAALGEAAAAAAADGAPLDLAGQWEAIEAMPPGATTSTALDVARGRPSELDAISGSVLRACGRLGVSCPTLSELVREAEAACPA
jgi:2-dehydropantoate 2-reductase